MIVSRHITYTDNPVCCERIEIVFDPPVDIDSPLGKVGSLYKDRIRGAKQVTRRPCKAVVNANGLLHVKEVMQAGELLAIRIRPGHRFRNLVLDKAHQLQVMPDAHRLQYWITAGRDGVVEVTGEMVKDDEGFFAKLKSNLKDIPYRAYIVQRSSAGSKMAIEGAGRPPDVMDTQQAAKYVGRSVSWLYKRAESGEIPRTPHKRFRKVDLDAFLAGRERKGKNRKR